MKFETEFNDGDLVYVVQCSTNIELYEEGNHLIEHEYFVDDQPCEIANVRIFSKRNGKYCAEYTDKGTYSDSFCEGHAFKKLDDAKAFADRLNNGDAYALAKFELFGKIDWKRT